MGGEEGSISEEHQPVPVNQKAEDSSGTKEEIHPVHQWRRPNLSLNIPSRKLEISSKDFVTVNMPPTPSPASTRVNMPPTPSPSVARKNGSPGSSSRGKSSMKRMLSRLSFKYRNSTFEIEKAGIGAAGTPSSDSLKKPSIMRSVSLTKIFTPRTRKTSSLPVTPIAHSNPESAHGGATVDQLKLTKIERYVRSLSMPANGKERNTRRTDCSVGKFRVVPLTPRVTEWNGVCSAITPTVDTDNNNNDGEDIPEEEAVCRICFIELSEGGETLKMECHCKGELALAHQECAIKWFSIKGNKNCDVCKQEVQNLPVSLLRIQTVQVMDGNANRRHRTATMRQYRICHGVPILVIVSMLAYFCLLEQLLVSALGVSAIALSLPFSCMLGLFASLASATMVREKYVWVYATLQFVLVGIVAHVFYKLIHVQAVLSILLAAIVALGFMMSTTSILFEFLKWWGVWRVWLNDRRLFRADQLPEEAYAPQTGRSDHGTQTENAGIP